MADEGYSEISAVFAEFSTKMKSLEERHEMLKERVLLISQSFLRTEERTSKELALMREEFREARMDLDRIKENVQTVIRDSADFARREELGVLEKYMKLWEPLQFMKENDVKKMINEKLKK
jgi:archaellum component FlaC